jgi:hypothetical protein
MALAGFLLRPRGVFYSAVPFRNTALKNENARAPAIYSRDPTGVGRATR